MIISSKNIFSILDLLKLFKTKSSKKQILNWVQKICLCKTRAKKLIENRTFWK